MPENQMFKNIQKVLNLITELRGMSLEDLKDICMQYGEDYSSNSKDELIRTIMEVELSHQELEDYEKYLKYYYFSVFREQMTGLSELDGYISQIEELYKIKHEAGLEENRAADRKRTLEFKLMDALPLVRLNIEYSHVESSYNSFIKVMTKTGMKLASITEAKEELQRKGLLMRFLKKGTIEDLERQEGSYREQRNHDMDEAYGSYVETVKGYGAYLKEAFFKMLDNREIAEAVYLFINIEMDFNKEEAYKLAYVNDCRFTDEEKEEIFNSFVKKADFDPERDVTGEMFYEAVKKFVSQYYDIMQSRLSLRQSKCVSSIKQLVGKQREIVDGMKKNQEEVGVFSPEDESTLSLIYHEEGRRKK